MLYYASRLGRAWAKRKKKRKPSGLKKKIEKSFKKLLKNHLTNGNGCAILTRSLTNSDEHKRIDAERFEEKDRKKFEKLLKNPLTNENECAIIIKLSASAESE